MSSGEHIDKQYFLYTKRIHYTQIGFLILIFSNPNKNACYCDFDENAFAVACSISPLLSIFNKVFLIHNSKFFNIKLLYFVSKRVLDSFESTFKVGCRRLSLADFGWIDSLL